MIRKICSRERRSEIPPTIKILLQIAIEPKTHFITRREKTRQVELLSIPKQVLTVVKEMSDYEVFSESDDTEYSPYIAPPLSTSPETIRYSTLLEPALISALEPLDIDFFFTLTVLHVPTLNDGDLVCPLIIMFTASEKCVQRIRTIV